MEPEIIDYILVFANCDVDGNITESLIGPKIIPMKIYTNFHMTEDPTIEDTIDQYKFVNGELVPKEV